MVSPGTPVFTPPAYSVPAFNAATLALGATITSVTLESVATSAQNNVPFRFGQVFKQGEVAPSDFLLGKIAGQADVPLQFNPLASFSDGSVRHALVSGVLPTIGAGARVQLGLTRVAAGTSRVATAPAAFSAAGFALSAVLDFNGVSYIADAAPAIAALTTANARGPGPISTEYDVMVVPKMSNGTPHPDLEVRFNVIFFPGTNAFKADVVFEHTKAFTNTGDVVYSGHIQVGGQNAYTLPNPVTHHPHATWMQTVWINNASPLLAYQEKNHFIGSKAVLNYDTSVVIADSVLANAQNSLDTAPFGPMGNGIFLKAFPGTGGRPDIGPLPSYMVSAILSTDKRALKLALACGAIGGSWGMHYRDASTGPGAGYPISCINWPYMTAIQSAADTNPDTGHNEFIPTPASSTDLYPDDAHQPNFAYFPYLVTGDLYYLDEMQFWCTGQLAQTNYAYRGRNQGLIQARQVRAQAWQLRNIVECAAFTPDSHPLKSHFAYWLNCNISNYDYIYTHDASKKLGCLCDLANDVPYQHDNGKYSGIGLFQDDFFTSIVGHIVELGYVSALPLLQFKAKFQVGRMIAPDYSYINATPICLMVWDKINNKFLGTLAECQVANIGVWDGNGMGYYTQATHDAGTDLVARAAAMNLTRNQGFDFIPGEIVGYAEETDGYVANYQPGLALAVDSGYPGGAEAWAKYQSRTVKQDFSSSAQFAVVPRGNTAIIPVDPIPDPDPVPDPTPDPSPDPATPTDTQGTRMTIADRVEETTTATSVASITLLGKSLGRRTFLTGFGIGTSGIRAVMDDDQGSFVQGLFTLSNANTLVCNQILMNSLGTTEPIVFGSGTKRVYHDLFASDFNKLASADDAIIATITDVASTHLLIEEAGVTKRIAVSDFLTTVGVSEDQLSALSSLADGDQVMIRAASSGLAFTATVAVLRAAFVNTGSGSGTTTPVDGTAPSIPGGTSSSATSSSATLVWAASTDNSGVAPSYEVSKDGTTWTVLSANTFTYTWNGLSASTQYSLQVRSVDGSGNKSGAAIKPTTTAAAPSTGSGDTQNPSMSGSINVLSVTATGLTMTYSAGSDDVAVARYEVSVDTGTANWVNNQTNLSYSPSTALTQDTAYTLRVRCIDTSNKISNVLTVQVTTPAQATPIYTVTGYDGNTVHSTIDTTGQNVFPPLKLVHPNAQTNNGYFYLHDANGNSPASASFGWGTSPTVPPAEITIQQNANQGASINGLVPMQPNAAFYVQTFVALTNGAGTVKLYPWFKGAGDIAQCVNTNGVTFTNV